MALQNVTYYRELSFCSPYYSSIFQDNKLSEEARRLVDPVWKAEKTMRLEIVNRINTLLYNRKEPLMFDFKKDFVVFWRCRSYTVAGIRSEVYEYRKDLRILKVILERDAKTVETDTMYSLGLNELIKLYEMVARALNPRT